jgi:hypothetical protein
MAICLSLKYTYVACIYGNMPGFNLTIDFIPMTIYYDFRYIVAKLPTMMYYFVN